MNPTNENGVYSYSGSIDFTYTIAVKHWFVCDHFPTQINASIIDYLHIDREWTYGQGYYETTKNATTYCEFRAIYSNIYLLHKHTYTWYIMHGQFIATGCTRGKRECRTFDKMVIRPMVSNATALFIYKKKKHNNVHIINYVSGRKHINVSWQLRYGQWAM